MSEASPRESDFPEPANEPDDALRFPLTALAPLCDSISDESLPGHPSFHRDPAPRSFAQSPAIAQNAALDDAKKKPGLDFSDPRLRNILRPIKEDPAAAIKDLQKNPDDLLREATRVFNENKDKIDTEKVKTSTVQQVDTDQGESNHGQDRRGRPRGQSNVQNLGDGRR